MIRDLMIRFAAESDGPAVHITPGGLFEIGGLTVTNSMFYAVIAGVLILLLSIYAARKMTLRPQRGIVQLFEIGTEFIMNLLASSLGSRKKAVKYSPYFVTIFFFILFSNWLGLAPGVGEALTMSGQPVFRPFTADLNGTLAAAAVSMFFVQRFSIQESGLLNHLRHYFNGSMKNPITLFLGVFEMLTEFIRIASLALRLFLVITVGEIIIAVFAYLGGTFAGPITALPFVFLEILVAALQAYIFVMLSVMYLAVAVKHGAEHDPAHDEPLPELKKIHDVSG